LEERFDRGLFEAGHGLRLRAWGVPWRTENWALTDAIGPEDDARRALLPAAIEHLRRQPHRPAVLALGRTRATSAFWDGLTPVASWSRYSFAEPDEFVVRTDTTVEAFRSRLSRNTRQTLSRAERRLAALDDVEFARAVSREELFSEFPTFLQVEASGWKGQHGSAISQSGDEAGYFRALLERLSLDGRCEIHTLRAEGRCIASGFWVFTGRGAELLKCGYDESYSRVSPGRLLTQKSFERCCEDPSVDFVSMLGDAPWVSHWIPVRNPVRRAYVSLRPVSGTLALVALRFRFGPFRRAVRAFRAWRRDRDDRTLTLRGRDSE
jgi:CelD/BcsL family acetyltransferase involved in cellulose biosynthesis